MDSALPLRLAGFSFSIAATPSASPACLAGPGITGDVTYLIDATTTNSRLWVGYGPTSTAAQTNAVVPALGGPGQNCFPVAKGTVQSFSLVGNQFFSFIMEQGSATVTITPGTGT